MEYFKLLDLSREPFSNSPDPAFFYESAQHKDCIQKLEIALRLRRGLNVVTGEVGTGKTTLCRQLIQAFSDDEGISTRLLLDPDFPNPRSFLAAVVLAVTGHRAADGDSIPAMKEHLKQYLFREGVEAGRTVALIVDEGQKMPSDCLETLRELLNFETNEHKLFQVVIFAQNEFAAVLEGLPNLADRINLFYRLGPLNFRDTRALIRYRVRLAGGNDTLEARLFSMTAFRRIFRLSGGFPRKIVHLCHQCLLTMIIQNKTTVTGGMVSACARRTFVRPLRSRLLPVGTVLLITAILGLGAWQYSGRPEKTSVPAALIDETVPAESFAGEQARAQTDAPQPGAGSDETSSPESNTLAAASDPEPSPPPVAPETEANRSPPIEDPPEEENDTDAFPTLLGRVPVAPGDTLGGLVQKIYGAYTYRHHQAMLAANPGMNDPDSLIAGQTLAFPALSAETETVPNVTWWVVFSRKPDLGSAVKRLREETTTGLPLRLLAVQTPKEGLSFRVSLKTCFDNERMAEVAIEQLETSIPPAPEVFCLKTSEAIVYGSLN